MRGRWSGPGEGRSGPGRGCSGLLAALALGCTAGCTVSPQGGPVHWGSGEWLVRSNPAPCLLDLPALRFEVRVGAGWQRVWVEADAREGSLIELAAAFSDDPLGIRVVRGDLRLETRPFGGGQPARRLRLEAVLAPRPEVEPAAE